MTDPVTHLFSSWAAAGFYMRRPWEKALVVFSGIFMDLDVLYNHHGPLHTPFIACLICLTTLPSKRFGKRLTLVCFSAMLLHLALDLVGSAEPLMLFYPLTDKQYSIGSAVSYIDLIALKFLFLGFSMAAALFLWSKGIRPTEVIEWSEGRVGRKTTYAALAVFLFLITYGSYGYLARLYEILVKTHL